jgi:hypothetical protein
MALLFTDSFDGYATADIAQTYSYIGTPAIAAGFGRAASAAMNLSAISAGATLYLPLSGVSGSTGIVGGAFTFTAIGVATSFVHLYNAPPVNRGQVNLHINTNGTLGIGRHITAPGGNPGVGDGSAAGVTYTVLGTSARSVVPGVPYHIQVKWTLHDTTGSAEVRVNGARWLALTNVDTNNLGSNGWTQVQLGSTHVGGLFTGFYLDDLWVCDGSGPAPWNGFLGDCRVGARVPTGAGASTGWTPSTGVNWACVDDSTPNADTDYTRAAALDRTDTFPQAAVAASAIHGVQTRVMVRKEGAAACTVAAVVRHESTNYAGAAMAPSTAYVYQRDVWATNPGTAAAWTAADFTAAEFGYTRIT